MLYKGLTVEIDVDGVLFDLWGTFFDPTQSVYAKKAYDIGLSYVNITSYNFRNLSEIQRQLVFTAFNDVQFMTHLNLCPEFAYVLNQLKNLCLHGHIQKIFINTLVFNEKIMLQRKQQLQQLFAVLADFVEIQVCLDKKQYNAVDIRIEDNPMCFTTVPDIPDNKQAKLNLLIDCPYNRAYVLKDTIRCKSLVEAVDIITRVQIPMLRETGIIKF